MVVVERVTGDAQDTGGRGGQGRKRQARGASMAAATEATRLAGRRRTGQDVESRVVGKGSRVLLVDLLTPNVSQDSCAAH